MDRNLWKKITDWFCGKNKSHAWAKWGYIPVILFYPNSLKLWFREHAPDFSPEFVTDVVSAILIALVVIYIPLLLIDYLRKPRK
ncbi:hypothetical protein [Xenorhabdus anantnagensis]|uniref:Colicin transporter n=1 Tax=Xenorhabdus anantnagensis TaxID=3025875 RepID=A0ABT5LYX1_9GAMM|nr:hypothetical protein [Xenorhabdus anantnagensis]MDC9599033.1 hypothetical protein [Xenorhabdus anantnagensis]